jgi:hypothetical protein
MIKTSYFHAKMKNYLTLVKTNVVWFFEFLKDQWFRFLIYLKIKEPLIPILWKKIIQIKDVLFQKP